MIKFEFWGRRAVHALIGVALIAALAACGGGGSAAGSSVFSGNGGASSPSSGASATAADLVVVLSKNSLSNTGTDTLTVTVTSIDANRATVANVPVSFSVDSNAIVTPAGTATGTSGTLTATVSEGSDTTVRVVNVTVTSGSVTRTVSFNVVQSVATTTPQAADLTLQLDQLNITNAGSTPVNATATAVDANRNALQGIPIQISVNSNAIVVVNSAQTDTNGQVKGVVTIGSDHSNRIITVTATSGTLVRVAAFQVIGATLQGTAVPTVMTAGASGNVINYALKDVNSNPMPNQAITVSGSGVASASGTTDSNGLYTYTYTAPSTPGAITISASAAGANSAITVNVAAGAGSVPTVTTPANSATLTVAPSVIAVNSGGTNNIATINTLFLSASNAPITNIRVRYDLNGDPNSVGGTIGAGTNLIYSDASGNASSTYTPGANTSPTNGLTIRACWDYADFAVGTCPHSATTTTTVVSNPVSITIGTDETVADGSSKLTYVKQFVVLVVDAAGNPKSDVQITPSIDLKHYYKGYYTLNGTIWDQTITAKCLNEDTNRNGVIDTGEDINGNGQLDPRKSDVSISMVGSTKTDSNGVAVMQIEYPKSVGSWDDFIITASAAGVLSPPAYYLNPTTPAFLPIPVSAVDSQVTPAFVQSPYGVAASCTNPN
jgi:hypothetical protein